MTVFIFWTTGGPSFSSGNVQYAPLDVKLGRFSDGRGFLFLSSQPTQRALPVSPHHSLLSFPPSPHPSLPNPSCVPDFRSKLIKPDSLFWRQGSRMFVHKEESCSWRAGVHLGERVFK